MTHERDLQGAVRSWLHEDRHEDAARVLHTVLNGVPTTPQHRPRWSVGGILVMNKFVTVGLGVAAVVAVLFIGAQLRGPTPGGEPSPTESASSSQAPASAEPSTPAGGSLPVGPFTLWNAPGDIGITATIPGPGWSGDEGDGMLLKSPSDNLPDGGGLLVFQGPLYVYRDACHWSGTTPDAPATTAEELIDALSAQASLDPESGGQFWNIGGSVGRGLDLDLPSDAMVSDCDEGQIRYWVGDPSRDTNARSHESPGQVDQLWIGDVNGVPVLFDVHFPGPNRDVVDELWVVVDHEATTFEMP